MDSKSISTGRYLLQNLKDTEKYQSIFIDDIEVRAKIPPSDSRLVPNGAIGRYLGEQSLETGEILDHLRWIAQKYALGQDIYLGGHPGPLRRNLAFMFAEICGIEVEYVSISKDTSESDLKQRREIINDSVYYHDQAPVRAAISGRILILDGVEKAERNVLPTLNNLLENREMALEDGRFLTGRSDALLGHSSSNMVRVHPDFRVIALGVPVPPYAGRTMDPPLRSRFQSRFIEELKPETILGLPSMSAISLNDSKKVLEFYESLRAFKSRANLESLPLGDIPNFSIDAVQHTIQLLSSGRNLSVADAVSRCCPGIASLKQFTSPRFLPELSHLYNAISSRIKETPFDSSAPDRIVKVLDSKTIDDRLSQLDITLLPSQLKVLQEINLDHACQRHICLFGDKVIY